MGLLSSAMTWLDAQILAEDTDGLDTSIEWFRPADPTDADNLNDYQEVTGAGVSLGAVSCSLKPLAGGEQLRGDQVVATQDWQVTLLRSGAPALDASCWGVWGSRTLQVRSVMDPNNRGVKIRLLCTEVSPPVLS